MDQPIETRRALIDPTLMPGSPREEHLVGEISKYLQRWMEKTFLIDGATPEEGTFDGIGRNMALDIWRIMRSAGRQE